MKSAQAGCLILLNIVFNVPFLLLHAVLIFYIHVILVVIVALVGLVDKFISMLEITSCAGHSSVTTRKHTGMHNTNR